MRRAGDAARRALRSPYEQVNGLVYFGRMLDKIRLANAGKLPQGWQPMRGDVKGSFDWRCCQFLKIDYAAIEAATKSMESAKHILSMATDYGYPARKVRELSEDFDRLAAQIDQRHERIVVRLA